MIADYDQEKVKQELIKARQFTFKYNKVKPSKNSLDKQHSMLKNFLGDIGNGSYIIAPFNIDLGYNIHIGSNTYINYNAVILDEAKVTIGDNCMIAPNLSIYTIGHTLDFIGRRKKIDVIDEVVIGNDVWIGGNVTILPGVKIGDRTVIGAGSLVTKDIPPDSLAYGCPCKVQKSLKELNDSELKKYLDENK